MKQKQFNERRAFRFKRFARKAYAAFNSMHKAVNIGVVSGFVLTFAHATSTSAQVTEQFTNDSFDDDKPLDEVVVTSSKADLTFNQTAKIVTVITRAEIARQPALSVQDLLKNVVGLDVRQRGSNGVLAGISVRGGTFEQTAILLNGVNISNPQTGHYNLDIPVNLSDIERIEIIQGPTSLLYGAGAFSGGVNIVTKKDAETGAYAKLESGSYGLFGAEGRGSYQLPITNYQFSNSVSVGYNRSDGYIVNSDYEQMNALWQSRLNVENSKLDFQLGYNAKNYGANTFYSPKYPNQYDNTSAIFAALGGETGGTTLKWKPQLYWNRHYDTYHLHRPGSATRPETFKPNDHRTDVFGANLNTQYTWKAGITNFGGELRSEQIYSNNLGIILVHPNGKYTKSANRSNISYFVEHNYVHDNFTLSAGVLANYNTAFNDDFQLLPNIGVGYWLNNRWKVFANWSNAVRMPTFTDLYYTSPTHEGNSDVQPEKSESFELGLNYRSPFIKASANGFYMTGKNLIDWVKATPADKWHSANLTNLDKYGFETNFSFSFKELIPQLGTTRLDLGYMYLDQSKKSGELISNYVMDYLHHKFTAGLSHPIYKGLTADWQFRWQDREGTYTKTWKNDPSDKDWQYEETAYPAFGLLDVKLNYTLRNAHIYLTVNNLFNKEYYDLGNIPQPGTWVIGGISLAL